MSKRLAGEGTVRHRKKDGRWEARIRLPDGRRKSVFGATADEANAKRMDMLTAIRGGLPIPAERVTVAEFLENWLTIHRPAVRPSTFACYRTNVRTHLVPAIGRLKLAKLTPRDVDRMMAEMTAKGSSPRTVQLARTVLRTALQRGVEWGDIPRNVADLVRGPRMEREPVDPWTAEEAEQFLEGVAGDRLEALYVCALTLGLRQGELLGLRWKDIDLERAELRVMMARNRSTGEMTAPKSARSRRVLSLPAITASSLRDHRTRQLQERLVMGPHWHKSDLVFTTGLGTPLDGSNVGTYFRRQCDRIGVRRVRFHDLRHSCASLLLAQGVGLREIMEWLGHSQISLTANTYSHVMPALKREAASQMDSVFAKVAR